MRVSNLKEVGPPNTSQDIKRFRRQVGDFLRRMGEPVVHLHKFTPEDVKSGVAKPCPACTSSRSGQTRPDCPVCFAQGWVSTANNPHQWISSQGYLTDTPTDTPAPLYGGFGPPILTRIVEPDVSTDEFRLSEAGVLTRVQEARGVAYWTPIMYDGDLLVDVGVTSDGNTVNNLYDRYTLRSVEPQTIRGWGVHSNNRREQVGQRFEMDRVIENNPVINVPIGGVRYDLI